MKFTSIQSSTLPEITDSIKKCINLGQWFLFKANTDNAEAFFFLKTGRDIYALSEQGKILTSNPVCANTEMNELFYFSDIPQPISLSNATIL